MTVFNRIGRISRADRNQFTILCDGEELSAKLRGTFYEGEGQRPVVGDFVRFSTDGTGTNIIGQILPRKSLLMRADQLGHSTGFVKNMMEQVMVANFDYGFILTSLNGNYNVGRIARYVSIILEGGGIPVVILTKADLCPDTAPFVQEVQAISPQVRVAAISTYTGEGLDALQEYLQEGVTIALLGSSGVGKSTLVNRLAGREIMKTGGIREKDSKGRHTTTARQLFLLEGGVTLIDTPGMRELGLVDAEEGVKQTFSDIEALMEQCRFRDCSHGREPGCAVQAALQSGELEEKRWEMYRRMLQETRQNSAKKAIAIQRKRLNKGGNRRLGREE